MNKVIIAAAGWKGAGYKDGLAGCPESFLPLGGATILSRTACIFAENGFKVYIAVGPLSYPYRKYVRWVSSLHAPVLPEDFPWDDSPWTQERLDYAATLGTIITVPDPGGWSTSLDTLCVGMDALGPDKWDGLLLACGDMVVPRICLEYMLALEKPFSLSFTAFHSYFFMDKSDAEFFRAYAEPFRRFKDEKSWRYDKDKSPGHLGSADLREAGFTIHSHSILPSTRWTDVDTMQTYHGAYEVIVGE